MFVALVRSHSALNGGIFQAQPIFFFPRVLSNAGTEWACIMLSFARHLVFPRTLQRFPYPIVYHRNSYSLRLSASRKQFAELWRTANPNES